MNITNPKVTEYIYSLYSPLTEELAQLREEGEKRHVPIILRDSETMLVTLVEMNKPDAILEIGTAIGYSAAVFSAACKRAGLDTKITTVEIDPLYANDAEKNLAGCDNVELIRADACDVMARQRGSKCYDMIFIDAAKSHYREFWEGALGLTHPGSLIICDNILMQARTADESYDERGRFTTNIKYMRGFLDHISSFEGAVTSILPVGDGMSISVIKQVSEQKAQCKKYKSIKG